MTNKEILIAKLFKEDRITWDEMMLLSEKDISYIPVNYPTVPYSPTIFPDYTSVPWSPPYYRNPTIIF